MPVARKGDGLHEKVRVHNMSAKSVAGSEGGKISDFK